MRHASRPPLARMMAIDQAVRAGRWPNATKLAAQLEVDPRTIRRDLTYMRDQLGASLVYDPHNNGYFYSKSNHRLPFLEVSEGELVALLLAGRLLGQYRGTPFEGDLGRAFRKLSELLPESVSIQLDTLGDCLAVLPTVAMEYDPAVFATLARASIESRRVAVVYHTAERDEVTKRTLDPYTLMLRDEAWYVVAHDSLRDDLRLFAVQRFRQAIDTGERFNRPADFRVDDFLAGTFGVVRGDGNHQVRLRFHPPTARRIAERRWQPGQTIESLPDGGLVLQFQVNDLRVVQRWVMSWGADCEVLGPEELKSTLRDELTRILSRTSDS